MKWLSLLLCLFAGSAQAHSRSESYSSWRVQGRDVVGIYTVDSRRVTQLVTSEKEQNDLPAVLAGHLATAIRVDQEGEQCVLQHLESLAAATGQIRLLLRYRCRELLATVAASLHIDAFRAVSPSHVHYARIEQPGGVVHEQVLGSLAALIDIGGRTAAAAPGGFWGFVRLGFIHVLSGPDHLAFLFAVILLAGTLRNAVVAATGFTLGHSLTLALVVLGWLHPDTHAIEALIGFTILFTALEAARLHGNQDTAAVIVMALGVAALPWLAHLLGFATPSVPVYLGAAVFLLGFGLTRPANKGWMAPLLATSFGLVHGSGFASGLIDLDLPRSRLLPALLGFNIGVEVAQLTALLFAVAVGSLVGQLPSGPRHQLAHALAAGLVGLGSFWFVSRSMIS